MRLASVKENIDPTTPTGKMMAGMLALFAEWEHETIREQLYENKMSRWRENRTFLGTIPFGYRWNNTLKKLEANPEEADIYLQMVKLCTEQGMTFRDIAINLNSKGYVTTRTLKNGKEQRKSLWSPVTVRYVLINPCYCGHYVVNKTKYKDGKLGAGTQHTNDPKPDSAHITFQIDALITKPEWDKIQETIRFHKLIPKHSNQDTLNSFLRSVVVCGRCGARLIVKQGTRRKDGTVQRYYACYWASTGKKDLQFKHKKCDLPYIPAEEVEKKAWRSLQMLFKIDSTDLRTAFNRIIDPSILDEQIARLSQDCLRLEYELERSNKKRQRIMRLLDRPELDEEEFSRELLNNDVDILTVKGKLDKAKTDLGEKRKLQADAKQLVQFIKDNTGLYERFAHEISELSLSDRKLLIESMLDPDKPIVIDYVPEDLSYKDPLGMSRKGKQSPGLHVHCLYHYNPEILKRFIDEGKINGLNLNSSQCCDRH